MLELADVSKSFGGADVLCGIDLHVAAGERVALLGANGAGKTTLLRLISGELRPDRGRIRLDGCDVTRLSVDARARAGIGRSFQQNSLFEPFSIRENLMLAASRGAGVGRDPLADPVAAGAAEQAATAVGLGDLDRKLTRLDYGTRRRLDLGMALAGKARLLLLDEPASGFGPGGAALIGDILAALPQDLTLILIEHDLDLARRIASRVVTLAGGRIAADTGPGGC